MDNVIVWVLVLFFLSGIFASFKVLFFLLGIFASLFKGQRRSKDQHKSLMGDLEARLKKSVNEDGIEVIEVQAQGLLPVTTTTRVGFATFIFDITDGRHKPILSMLEAFQEPGGIGFRFLRDAGECSPFHGFSGWASVGIIVPGAVCPPYSGNRSIKVVLWLVDLVRMSASDIRFSSQMNDIKRGILWRSNLNFSYIFQDKGYEEVMEHRHESQALSIELGVAVAMADGGLDEREGLVLKKWIIRAITPFSEEMKSSLKAMYNDALRGAFEKAKQGKLNLHNLAARLNEIGEKRIKYEAIELCLEVMVADKRPDSNELRVIRDISRFLELDYDEIERIKDQKIIKVDSKFMGESQIEEILNIDPDWSKEETKRHLRKEFQKWNNRMNVLSEGDERDNAQKMLDLISQANRKYA